MAFHAFFSCESELSVQLWMTECIDQILIKGDRMFLHTLTNQLIADTSSLLVSHLPVLVFTISLITGWTVYTEKYKAQGLYEGPRDLYFSYRQSKFFRTFSGYFRKF